MSLERNLYEDGYDEPNWLQFQFRFFTDTKKTKNGKSSNAKVKEFEKLHPNLTLVMVDDISQTKFVFRGPVLYRADGKEYREIKYSYKKEGQKRYYKPSDLLYEWLLNWDEISEAKKWRKNHEL